MRIERVIDVARTRFRARRRGLIPSDEDFNRYMSLITRDYRGDCEICRSTINTSSFIRLDFSTDALSNYQRIHAAYTHYIRTHQYFVRDLSRVIIKVMFGLRGYVIVYNQYPCDFHVSARTLRAHNIMHNAEPFRMEYDEAKLEIGNLNSTGIRTYNQITCLVLSYNSYTIQYEDGLRDSVHSDILLPANTSVRFRDALLEQICDDGDAQLLGEFASLDLEGTGESFDLEPNNFEIQSDVMAYYAIKYLDQWKLKDLIKGLEDFALLVGGVLNATNFRGIYFALINYVKLRIGDHSLVAWIQDNQDYIKSFFGLELQSDEDWLEGQLKHLRSIFDNFENVKKTAIYQKLYKFFMYVLSLNFFRDSYRKFGMPFFEVLHRQAVKEKFCYGPSFWMSIVDTMVFLAERGYQCFKMGSLQPIYHSKSTYAAWVDKAMKLKHDSHFMSNPEPHGLNTFEWLADLNDCIEKGESIIKLCTAYKDLDVSLFKRELADLKMLKSEHITKRSAMEERKAPFSVLIYGGSSVGKSTFTKLLYLHYGKLFNLPTGSEFKYTRNPVDKHWNNFNSTQWCIQLDDIAFLSPKLGQADPSLLEVIQVQNYVPMVPPQADLADKGRTPVRCRLLIATTNTQHLNAGAYFANPLAVQRRFPYVLEIKPKAEYCRNGVFLDGTKVPPVEEGTYPDYWDITVRIPVPHDAENIAYQSVKYEDVQIFHRMSDFLVWFNEVALHHNNLGDKISNCDEHMNKVTLCECCNLPASMCRQVEVQSHEIKTPFVEEFLKERIARNIVTKHAPRKTYGDSVLIALFHILVLVHSYNILYLRGPASKLMLCIAGYMSIQIAQEKKREICANIGSIVQSRMQPSRLVNLMVENKQLLYMCAGLLTAAMFAVKFRSSKKSEEVEQQGNLSSTIGTRLKAPKEERLNPWYNDKYEVTDFDVSRATLSMSGLPFDTVKEIVRRNVVFFEIRHDLTSEVKIGRGNAFCIGGHQYLFNSHYFYEHCPQFEITILDDALKEGVSRKCRAVGSYSSLKRVGEDLVLLKILGLPPKRDLRKLLPKRSFDGVFDGVYLHRTNNGEYEDMEVKALNRKYANIRPLGTCLDTWVGKTPVASKIGFCGSVLLGRAPLGPVILGIHYGYAHDEACTYAESIHSDLFTDLDITSVTAVELSCETVKVQLQSLHHKSSARYVQDGCASVFGTLSLPHGNMKTRVCQTLIAPSIVKKGLTQIKHTGPNFRGWRVWYDNFKEMTNPAVFNTTIMDEVAENFISDIETRIGSESIKDIVVLDDMTAINGAPGVTYVDKINFKTSMGYPWCKSKRNFVVDLEPEDDWQEPKTFTPEIMDEVDRIITTYKRGERCHPVFSTHQKDEPRTFEKVAKEQHRLHCGAPGPWVIVVRKYLLTCIRFIQKHRYVFETAVGINPMSLEWSEMFVYLTEHGTDRIIAGDYSKFDKRMPAAAVMAAFDVIKFICRKAGYSDDDMRVVSGIAEDTAYPLVNFNGDLVEFYGTNPSGHPLTVIINSIVNSLYLRYCYKLLNPRGSALDFKDNVSLMTYGDDNIMGVSIETPWFNHTSIQSILSDIGVGYTMADKEQESVPYISIYDATFLKRSYRRDYVYEYICAPLDMDSIHKMLTVCVKSKEICAEQHAVIIMNTALFELVQHGEDIFGKYKSVFEEIVNEYDLHNYMANNFHTYEYYMQSYITNSTRLESQYLGEGHLSTLIGNHATFVKAVTAENNQAIGNDSENGLSQTSLLGRSPKSLFREGLLRPNKIAPVTEFNPALSQ